MFDSQSELDFMERSVAISRVYIEEAKVEKYMMGGECSFLLSVCGGMRHVIK